MRLLNRMWQSPRLIPILSVLTVIALAGAAYAVFGVLAVDEQQERDRISADLASCARGNILRQTIMDLAKADVALGVADGETFAGIIDAALPPGANPRIDEIRAEIQPYLDERDEVLSVLVAIADTIVLTDCASVTPGGSTPTTTTEGNP